MKLLEMLQRICKLPESIYVIAHEYVCAKVNFLGTEPTDHMRFSYIDYI